MEPTNTTAYFATDGNYGSAAGIVIADTALWSEEEWNEIEEAPDYLRAATAETINARHAKR